MKRFLLILLGIVVVVGAGALGFVGWMVFQPAPMAFAGGTPVALADYKGPSPTGVPAELAHADLLTRGKYLTEAADCEACHTKRGGTPYAGGLAFVLPFGTLYTPNITPDPETGIGKWTDADFLKAVHKGIGLGGERLYPAFPYTSYTMLTDQDVLAIKAYIFSLKPVRQVNRTNSLVFPFNQRWLMAIWATLFNSDKRFRPIPQQSPQWNRGAYLVEAAAHCGECHSPRNLLQAPDTRRKFAGGAAEGWNAYNITPSKVSGIGDWSAPDLASYLSTGYAVGRGTASGPMREAVEYSLSKLTPGDIAAIVTYVRSVPPRHSHGLPRMAGPASASPKAGPGENVVGKRMFEGNCASCHAWTGQGALVQEARLAGDRAVNDVTAANVAQMVLNGVGTRGEQPYMPSFGHAYTDREVAAVANYVTARFGSKPSSITPEQVAKLRTEY